MKKFIATALALTLSYGALACTSDGKKGIVEDNNLNIPVGIKGKYSVDEVKFNALITKAEKVYGPIVKELGGNLKIERKWTDGTVNAYAQRQGSTFLVSMFGGLARHSTITADGFNLVICHEIGHHIGGAPKKVGTWASNEGQADYWGSMKCLRRMWQDEDNVAVVEKMQIPEAVVSACSAQFSNEIEIAICKRGAMAGKSLAYLFQALRNMTTAPDFTTPDRSAVARTNDAHPAPQCRMDTYYAGSLCDSDFQDNVSNTDENQGVCSQKMGDKLGTRPLCWFKPKA
jgi:hypothetical protein